ncbi:MAG: DUF4430 domain-containing protein [Oscillibacter sp.]|nr:DUF4430 domain-containing protein [Oscillibacter sp.]
MRKKPVLYAIILVVVMAVFLGVWYAARPQTTDGEKNLTIQVIHSDQSSRTFEVATSAEYLAEALTEQGIVQGDEGPYGLYILAADGETANEANQEWWCITRGGESLTTGASETPIADGEHYELTLMVGYGS